MRFSLVLLSLLCITIHCDAAHGDDRAVPAVVKLKDFDSQQLTEPPAIYWPAYFWLWNGPLRPEILRAQLQDMRKHDARNVCVLPMPRDFRPDTTANRMDVDYLSPEFFARVKVAVDEAAELGMHYWLYDEGGWPSGQATGRVAASRPDLAMQIQQADEAGHWSLKLNSGRPDMLNPETTRTFIGLTHEKYRDIVGNHFGNTIELVFTDEPAYPAIHNGRNVPWTTGADDLFAEQFQYRLSDKLSGAFRQAAVLEYSAEELQHRIDAFDFWSGRFRDAYFEQLRTWCREHEGLAHGGHLGGEDETLGAVTYGFGHALRQMRAMDVPGVDIIWRQVFPGKINHHFPKFASSAAHQNGTALALTESFCVYGNGLTPAQMKWLIDWQYVRGINLLVAGCYPLSTEDHAMLGERPHFGPVDPLWDFLPKFHQYVARLGYILSCGEPVIETALYYPVRDMWATGGESSAASTHDALAQRLLERQCDFDLIDDDLLSAESTRVENGMLIAGHMRYRSIVSGPHEHMSEISRKRLAELEHSGGTVIRAANAIEAEAAVQMITPTVLLKPSASDIRVQVRRWPNGGVLMVFNEGLSDYTGEITLSLAGEPVELSPSDGRCTVVPGIQRTDDGRPVTIPVQLIAGESRVFLFRSPATGTLNVPEKSPEKSMTLSGPWQAHAVQQYVLGEHNFERLDRTHESVRPIELGNWTPLVGPDFSGRVVYQQTVRIPDDWHGRLRLDPGRVDYAARVRVNAEEVGVALWQPTFLDLPFKADSESGGRNREFVLTIEVANTLANELTSERVQKVLAHRSGPGWPGPYHDRAIVFEKESRSGGLYGPVRLILLEE